jgi:hypothetical protein
MSEGPSIDTWGFKRGALIYPQPVAFACGRLLRVSQPQERIDACLKAAEILCRYLCALALSSLRGRGADAFPETVKPLVGDLAFGQFLGLVQAIAKTEEHPLQPYLVPFRARGKGKNRSPGKADAPLVALLELRNELGHDLAPYETARAITLLEKHDPEQRLLDALGALEGVLSLPLFVLDNFSFQKRQLVAQRLLLMGDSPDPIPDQIQLSEPLEARMPYVAIDRQAMMLPPVILFALIKEQCAYRLAFLDAVEVKDESLRFKTQESREFRQKDDRHEEFMSIFAGDLHPLDKVHLLDGSNMPQSWAKERQVRENAGRLSEGLAPWDGYSSETLEWYARRLPGESSGSPREHITAELLDGRSNGLSEDELLQLMLLFGTGKDVRKHLGREMIDLRRHHRPGWKEPDTRWDERISGSKNVFDSLKIAIDFFRNSTVLKKSEARDLTHTEGKADYVAMREAIINQFIHQDYNDASAAAQINLVPDRKAEFFNAGHSLVETDRLLEGGRSQARNPLIARALRLIGYAELAGSGIPELNKAWRKEKRRPPTIDSSLDSNTFTFTLNWEQVDDLYDEVWKDRVGARLTPLQAQALNLAVDAGGVTAHEVAAGTGVDLPTAKELLRFLVNQVLVEERDNSHHLSSHLRQPLDDRHRKLMKEFQKYAGASKRKLRKFSITALHEGFKHCYDQGDYATIVAVAAKLPEEVIQEDEKLLMYYDVATMRLGD